jgi:hypothetical protein
MYDGSGLGRLRTELISLPVVQKAAATPTTAPAAARMALSASICRISRHRVAPSDERTASSLARSVARANCMFMTLTQARTSTPAQKASMVNSRPRRNGGVKVLISGSTSAAS